MAFPIMGVLSAIGGVFSSIMGFKGAQAQTVQEALKVLGDTNASNAQREQAIASVLVSEAESSSWLTRMWRPITMMVFLGLIVSYWFGYVPPNFDKPMSPMMVEIFSLLKLGIGGYIGGRTLEKIISNIGLSNVLKKFIEKKIL